MSDNILEFTGVTTLDTNPERILKAALNTGLDSLVTLGFTEDGEFYFASNRSDAGTVIFLLEKAKRELLILCDEMEITE